MDTKQIALEIAPQLVEYRARVSGKADDAQKVYDALNAANVVLTEQHTAHVTSAATTTEHWVGKAADGFDRKAHTLSKSLKATASATGKAAAIIDETFTGLQAAHKAVSQLVHEYTTQAAALLDAALATQGAGAQAALTKAAGQVADMVPRYTEEARKHAGSVTHQMTEAAKHLKALQHSLEHDGFFDHKAKPAHRKDPKHPQHPQHPGGSGGGSTKPGGTAVAHKVDDIARSQLGYHEGAGNANKYGPKAAWCSSFATWVWRKAGVNIPILPFSGDVYDWGKQHGLAYDRNHLKDVRPGDVLCFGTGPQTTTSSYHIGIVESVHGNQVTIIAGNSGPNTDQVARTTYTLSPSTFYGGVHPK